MPWSRRPVTNAATPWAPSWVMVTNMRVCGQTARGRTTRGRDSSGERDNDWGRRRLDGRHPTQDLRDHLHNSSIADPAGGTRASAQGTVLRVRGDLRPASQLAETRWPSGFLLHVARKCEWGLAAMPAKVGLRDRSKGLRSTAPPSARPPHEPEENLSAGYQPPDVPVSILRADAWSDGDAHDHAWRSTTATPEFASGPGARSHNKPRPRGAPGRWQLALPGSLINCCDIGDGRIANMDAARIDVQVLSPDCARPRATRRRRCGATRRAHERHACCERSAAIRAA